MGRLSVVEIEEVREARKERAGRRLGLRRDGLRRRADPLPEAGERPLQAVRDGVGRELGHLSKALSEPLQMFREDLVPDVPPDPHGGEVGRREDERGHVADARVGHDADVLEAVGLLDEADGLLHAPAREVGVDDAPLRLERTVDRERREQHHRLAPEALHHDHVQLLLWVHGQPYGHRAERYGHVALPAVRVEGDVVGVAHRALHRKVARLVHAAPRQDVPPGEPYDEVSAFADKVVVERGPVASPVIHRDAFPARRGVHGLDHLQHLVVLALEARRA